MKPAASPAVWAIALTLGSALVLLVACGGGSSAPMPAPVPPAPAQQAGYTLRTYGPIPVVLANTSVISGIAGLFPWEFIDQGTGGSASTNGDGSITVVGAASAPNAQLASARSGSAAGSFEGIAFGGGAYFEAVLKFDGWQGQSSNPNDLSGGWPAFWSMAVEHLAQTGADQVPVQAAGYEDFIEMDFMEYNIENIQANDYVYSGSMIDWNGVFGQTCSNSYCAIENSYTSKIRQLPETVDFSVYHSYGALWVPATADTDGYLQWYFDGAPVGQQVSWPELTDSSVVPPPPFGIADQQHLVVILGTGTQYPMTISSVSVWQKSRADNLIR